MGLGVNGGLAVVMLLNLHNISGCSSGKTFTIWEEIHDSSHEGMVLLGVQLLNFWH